MRAPALGLATLLALPCAQAQLSSAERARGEAIVADVGCNSCHASISVPGAPPLAPDWAAIRARWARAGDAEATLAATIVEGTRERHWKGSAMFEAMLPNAPWVAPEDGRLLARWILAAPKP